jgi:hypothetical protein
VPGRGRSRDAGERCRPGIAAVFAVLAVMLALLGGSASPVLARQTTPLATGAGEVLPLATIASGEAAPVSRGQSVAWLVQRKPPGISPGTVDVGMPLDLVVPGRGLSRMHGEHNRGRGRFAPSPLDTLAPGEKQSLGISRMRDDVTFHIALVPAAMLPQTIPPGVVVSEPFASPEASPLRLALRQGSLAPGTDVAVAVVKSPVLLVAMEGALQIDFPGGGRIDLARGELALLEADATLRNATHQHAAFAVAQIAPNGEGEPPAEREPGKPDSALAEAWDRLGCARNPGNPSCVTVGLATSCALDAGAPGCTADSDGDACTDVAEVRAGLDPFNRADCVSAGSGKPAVNCLFLTGGLACDGGLASEGTACLTPSDMGGADGCHPAAEPAARDCAPLQRDPTCDGFLPTSG